MTQLAIRTASETDLPAIYDLARRCLTLDRFTIELLREKLFNRTRPDQFAWDVFIAENAGRALGFMQSVIRECKSKAWIGMFAVEPAARRQGIATALYGHAARGWPAAIASSEVLAIPCNYFNPGLDPRYTEALCFVEKMGYKRFRDCVNMRGELLKPFDTTAEEKRLAAEKVEIRRARRDDDPLLDAFFAANFGEDWRGEAALAMINDPIALHLALRDGRIIAFSGHSSQNREWGFFGPMGTAPQARGLGLGRVLLWHCLNDLHAAGHRACLIPWVGPISFYQQWAGCRVERVFWRYEREISRG